MLLSKVIEIGVDYDNLEKLLDKDLFNTRAGIYLQ
jgi:hypothetical protein